MKAALITLIACMSIMTAAPILADSYDAQWIAQCIEDNKDEKVPVEVITKYCTCMNNKMSNDETRSITQWEKTHPREQADCAKQAGWD